MGKSLEASSSISLHNRKIRLEGHFLRSPLQATYRSTLHLVMPPGLLHRRPQALSSENGCSKLSNLAGQPPPDSRTWSAGPSDASYRQRRFAQLRAAGLRKRPARPIPGVLKPRPRPPRGRRPQNPRPSLLPTGDPRPGFPPSQRPLRRLPRLVSSSPC